MPYIYTVFVRDDTDVQCLIIASSVFRRGHNAQSLSKQSEISVPNFNANQQNSFSLLFAFCSGKLWRNNFLLSQEGERVK